MSGFVGGRIGVSLGLMGDCSAEVEFGGNAAPEAGDDPGELVLSGWIVNVQVEGLLVEFGCLQFLVEDLVI